MIKLEINNSYSKVSGLNAQQERKLRDVLSYVVGGKNAYFSGFGPRKRSLLSKRGEFPTGLLARVQDCMKEYGIICSDQRKRPKQISPIGLDIKPYQAQKLAVYKALEAGRGTISMPTGTGKSLVIAMIAAQLNVKTLVVVPSLEIKKQLSETLKDLPNVTVENIDSKTLQKPSNYDCLIIDEGHHVAAKTYQKLNKTAWAGIYYRFFMTATAFRNDTEETLLFESIAGDVIYRLTYQDAIKAKYIVPVEAYYVELPKQKTNAYTWSEVYSELIVNNDYRNEVISVLTARLNSQNIPTLCLVKEVAHGKILSNMTGFSFVHGSDDDSRDYIRQFNSGNLKAVIGTTGILGEGIDTKPAEFIIIAGLGKAKSQFMQQVGRAVRNYPGKETAKIILFKDRSHKFTLRHFNEQKKILLAEYGVIPLKLKL